MRQWESAQRRTRCGQLVEGGQDVPGELAADAPGGARHAEDTIARTVIALYNRAQLRVVQRLNIRLARLPPGSPASAPE
ncbi:hypothetical protein [Nocardia sp. NPDC024068]|uniref:hypothetical protein n=1 Tax=Nocardia sp. NPDC024068 TaxID=3157197 RepID=UPI0033DEBC0F